MLSPFRTGPPRLLQDHPVFASRDLDDARTQMARLFCDHGLQPVGPTQAVDCHMHRVALGGLDGQRRAPGTGAENGDLHWAEKKKARRARRAYDCG